jgi:murein DD-endopeptidase MepM/ murein hydrolase activator NlpD
MMKFTRLSMPMLLVKPRVAMLRMAMWGVPAALGMLGSVPAPAAPTDDAIVAQQGVTLQGSESQGGLYVGKAAPGARVMFNAKALKVGPHGEFVFGFDRDAEPGDTLVVTWPDGRRFEKAFVPDKRKYDIQRVDGVPGKTVNPDPADLKRIEQDNIAVGKARAVHSDRTDFAAGFQWPLLGRISGVFGSQRIYNGEPRQPHYGVDVAAPVGTLVRAPAAGKVTLAHKDMFFSGGTLMIDHGHGLSSTFLHLSAILVPVGQEVKPGDVIAKVGATGRATGPHLDWRMNWFGRRVDPQLLVLPMAQALADANKTANANKHDGKN